MKYDAYTMKNMIIYAKYIWDKHTQNKDLELKIFWRALEGNEFSK